MVLILLVTLSVTQIERRRTLVNQRTIELLINYWLIQLFNTRRQGSRLFLLLKLELLQLRNPCIRACDLSLSLLLFVDHKIFQLLGPASIHYFRIFQSFLLSAKLNQTRAQINKPIFLLYFGGLFRYCLDSLFACKALLVFFESVLKVKWWLCRRFRREEPKQRWHYASLFALV